MPPEAGDEPAQSTHGRVRKRKDGIGITLAGTEHVFSTEDVDRASLPEYHVELDPMRRAVAGLQELEEALVRRMLSAWDPTWGEPELVLGPSSAHIPKWDDPPDRQQYRVTSWILGLSLHAAIGGRPEILVLASDHIDEHGNVAAPIPDKGMLAIMQARLTRKHPPARHMSGNADSQPLPTAR